MFKSRSLKHDISFWVTFALSLVIAIVLFSGINKAEVRLTILTRATDLDKALCSAFEKENSGIKLDVIEVSGAEIDTKFLAMVAGGIPVDLLYNAGALGFTTYAYDGLLRDLAPYIQRDSAELKLDDFPTLSRKGMMVGNKVAGMPCMVAMGMCVMYNATLLEEAGLTLPPTDWDDKSWTWDRMVAYAKKLTRVDADGRASQFGVDSWESDPLIQYSWAAGGDWFTKKSYELGIVDGVTLNSPENVLAYQLFTDLKTKHRVAPGGPLLFNMPGTNVRVIGVGFWGGKVAMYIYPAGLPDPTTLPQVRPFKWGYAPFPSIGGKPVDRAFAFIDGYGIPSTSRHPEEAWRFIKFVTSSDGQLLTKNWASRNSVWANRVKKWLDFGLSALPPAKLLQAVMGSLQRAVAPPMTTLAGYMEIRDSAIMKELVPALLGQRSVEEGLQKAQKSAEGILRQFKQKRIGEVK